MNLIFYMESQSVVLFLKSKNRISSTLIIAEVISIKLYFFLFFIYCSKTAKGLLEWGIIELQGDLETRGNEAMDNQFVGDLNYDKYGQPVSDNIIFILFSSNSCSR